jgi:YD repeat-containing protein
MNASGEEFFFEYAYNAAQKEYYRRVITPSRMVKEVWSNQNGETTRVDINGRTVKTLDKNEEERTLKITDEKGNVLEKRFDEWENLVEVIYSDNTTESYDYEYRFHRPIRSVDRRGYVTTYLYDEYGNLLQITEAVATPAETVTTLTYDEQHQLLTITQNADANTEGATISFTYDAKGNITSLTDALGYTLEVLQYDVAGNPLEIKDYRGFSWHYSYDVKEQLKSVTNSLGQIQTYEYNGSGNLSAIKELSR